MADATLTLLLYFILPLWLLAGVADWLCHRAARIERTTGAKETLLHLLMFVEVGVPLAAAIFLQVNAAIFLLMIAGFLVHEATALWDVTYAVSAREVTPLEQHVHSFLELIPLMAILVLGVRHWDQLAALFGSGDATPDWSLRRKDVPLPAGYVASLFGAIVLLVVLPYLEELYRGLGANGGEFVPQPARDASHAIEESRPAGVRT
jgi:hypothetical protein